MLRAKSCKAQIHQPGALSTSSRQVAVRCNPLYRLRHNGVRSREWGVYGRSSSCGPALPGPVGPLMDMGAGPALPRPDMDVLDSLRELTRSAAPRPMSPSGAQAAGAAERRASYRGAGREESPIRPLCAGSAPSGPCWDRSPPCGGVRCPGCSSYSGTRRGRDGVSETERVRQLRCR